MYEKKTQIIKTESIDPNKIIYYQEDEIDLYELFLILKKR